MAEMSLSPMKLTKKQRDEQTLKIVGNHLGFSTKRICQSFKLLSEIEKIVLSIRFGVEPAGGQDFELNRERIRQMEAKALKKLRRGIRHV